MHPQAHTFVSTVVSGMHLAAAPKVLDLGGRVAYEPAGTIHDLFDRHVKVLDRVPGVGVDIVANAASWVPDSLYNVVLCTEVFEHTPSWPKICFTAHAALYTGGVFIATCARDARPPHCATTGGALPPGEFYKNVPPSRLVTVLEDLGWSRYAVYAEDGYFGGDDLYAWAIK